MGSVESLTIICKYIKIVQRDWFNASTNAFEGLIVMRHGVQKLVSGKRTRTAKRNKRSNAEIVGIGRVHSRITISLQKVHHDGFADLRVMA